MELRNMFEDLHLGVDATAEQVQMAYRGLAHAHHPDRAPGEEAAANEAMARINVAYHALKDKVRRAAHRREIEGHWKTTRNGLGAIMTSEGWLMPGAHNVPKRR